MKILILFILISTSLSAQNGFEYYRLDITDVDKAIDSTLLDLKGKDVSIVGCKFESKGVNLKISHANTVFILATTFKSDTTSIIIDSCETVYLYNVRTFKNIVSPPIVFTNTKNIYFDSCSGDLNDEREYLKELFELFKKSYISAKQKEIAREKITELLKSN